MDTMLPFIDPQNCKLLFAQEYLHSFPMRGRPFAAPSLGLQFYEIDDCIVMGEEQEVVAPLHNHVLPVIFRESGVYPSNELPLPGRAQQALAKATDLIDIPLAVPLFAPGSRNLWHWTLESLPKLLMLEHLGYTGPYVVLGDSPVVRDSLDMFGIAHERRLPAGPAYRVQRLILPPQLSGFVLPENVELVAFLRDRILDRVGILPGSKRCYVRRIGRRRIINEAPMLELLREFDFEVMVPEDLTLVEQWRYMTNVECSLMAHGANTTLTLTQPHGSAFVEFFSNRYINYSNMQAIRLLHMRYLPLVEELDVSWYPDKTTLLHTHLEGGIPADIEVQLIHLRMHLEVLLSGKR